MNLIWHPDVEQEINEGVDFYLEKEPGVEMEFIAELEAAVSKLIKNPTLPREFDPPYRKVVTNRFPYQIIYRINERCVWIVAVMQQNRQPGYWMERESTWEPE